MQTDIQKKEKRIALYVLYDKEGIVDDYVVFQLEQLRTEVEHIVAICQGYVREDNKSRIEVVADEVIYRENTGYDAGAWKDAMLNHIGWKKLSEYDELVLMNDSCFGPVFPFCDMFDEMESREVDFWGVTEHTEMSDHTGKNPYGFLPRHIQTYFICLRKEVFQSTAFVEFWTNYTESNDFELTVATFETVLTRRLEDAGFRWDIYAKVTGENAEKWTNRNPTIFRMDDLLVKQKNPLIKKKSLMGLLDKSLKETDGNLARKCLEFIERETGYDTGLIFQNIIRNGHVRELYELYHWDYFLPENVQIKSVSEKKKIALTMHMYYDELIDYCHEYAKSMPENSDIYITVADEEKKQTIEKTFCDINCNRLEVRLINNRGMDISALLVGLRDVFNADYDYVCYVHDKMSFKTTYPKSGEGFRDNIFNCMLKSRPYVENIIETFENNPHLGLLVPPFPMVGIYIKNFGKSWHSNFEGTKELAERLKLNCNLDTERDTVSVGTSFWCRPQALKKLMEYPWKYESFDDNSARHEGDLLHCVERIFEYAAQDQGYYTGVVMPISQAQLVYSVENHQLRKTLKKNRRLQKKVDSKAYKCSERMVRIPRAVIKKMRKK